MLNPEDLSRRLIQAGLCTPKKLKGCKDLEIQKIESHIHHQLPKEYKTLLKTMGKGAGQFCSDVTMYYPSIVTLTEERRPLLAEQGVTLPHNAFVFADRDGEQLLFFHLGPLKPNPAIYRWHDETPHRFNKVFGSIWHFIEEELKSQEAQLSDDDIQA